ncbi:MAG: Ubiquinone biosynthesis O-methyltransferase [Alphaproteobacteria bacterium MarineAlpha6_Bin3]|nr:MAG: Ubiquinone biosynthesis O-methyltransferase [Alphaproteobacteria bacterium MarineAlpha6_Bin3]|tara:strand:+ start:4827 stop:5558 length:732 start_codon:yes stop_codon:yes gene_type:complete
MKSKKNNKFIYEHDFVPVGYYDRIYKIKKGIQAKWHDQKFNFVKKKMKNYKKHLDFGCSAGSFIGILDKKKKSIGFDISIEQVNYAKKEYKDKNHNFIFSKLPLPFPNNSFDTITFLEVIEHCDDDQNRKIINEIYRLLKPNGVLIITTPNYYSLWPFLEKIISFFGPIDYRRQHINAFNKKKLNNFLKLNNFIVVESLTFIYFAPFLASFNWKLASFVERVENRFLNLNFGFLLCGIFKKKK